MINEATGASRETVSNDVGEFDFSAVAPGTYTVRAALKGFQTYEGTGIRVATQQFLTVDLTLELGGLEETITVSLEAPLVDTTNASIGQLRVRAVSARRALSARASLTRQQLGNEREGLNPHRRGIAD